MRYIRPLVSFNDRWAMQTRFSFEAIGLVRSPFREKFGIPRQPGLVKVPASIHMLPEYSRQEAFRELQSFSHIWISFVFHRSMREHWKPTVRPPRLGGNERIGVFASRSMFRPNPLGLSVVELKAVRHSQQGMVLDIIGGDLLDGTPVLDIKPYLPYVDALPAARSGYAEEAPPAKLQVAFTPTVLARLHELHETCPDLQAVITEILQYDPRPAYQPGTQQHRSYAMRLYDYDVKWQVEGQVVRVTDVLDA